MSDSPVRLDPLQRAFVDAARRATLATVDPRGRPRLVPVCFVVREDEVGVPILYTPLDEKPKDVTDPRTLARVRDIVARPAVTILVDRWDEDWSRLAWVRLFGTATVLEPGPVADDATEHVLAVQALRAKYRQYAQHALGARPIIRVSIDRIVAWGDPS